MKQQFTNRLWVYLCLLGFYLTIGIQTLSAQINAQYDWEGSTSLIWTNEAGNASFSRITTAAQVCSGSGAVRVNIWGSNINARFISPALTGNNGNPLKIKFKYKCTNSGSTSGMPAANFNLITEWATSTTGTWTAIDTIDSRNHTVSATCAEKSLTATGIPASGDIYVRFRAQRLAGDNYLAIDDVLIYQENSTVCLMPLNFNANSITTTNVTINGVNADWTAFTSTNGYDYLITTSATTPLASTSATGSVTGNNFSVSNLTPNTEYYVWVRGNCGATEVSNWVGGKTFRTLCTPITSLPWTENFDGLTTTGDNIVPSCWTNVTGTKPWGALAANTSISARSGNNLMKINWSNTNASQLWTPDFELQTGTSYRFKFYYNTGTSTSLGWTGKVLVNETSSLTGATELGTFINATEKTDNIYVEYYYDYIPTRTGIHKFAISVSSASPPLYLGIDDVSFELTPSCEAPRAISLVNRTNSTADVKWISSLTNPADGYVYYINNSTTFPTTYSGTSAAGDTTGQFSGLTGNTDYYVWVKAVCSSSDTSAFVGPFKFTTLCDATNVPYSENFEGVTTPAIPVCMTTNALSGNVWNTNTVSSNKMARYTNSTQAANSWLYTQGINLTAGQSYRVSYKYYKTSSTSAEKIKVAYGTSATAAGMTNVIATHDPITATTLTSTYLDFIAPTTGVYYIGFNSFSAANLGTIYVDDILVDLSPACIEPTNLVVTQTTNNTATVKWNRGTQTPANGYVYYVSTTNTIPSTHTGVVATDTFVNITSLIANTPYYVWVKAACSATDSSVITGPITLRTMCDAVNVPYLENFEAVVTPNLPECTSVINAGTGNLWKTASITANGFSGKVLNYAYNSSNAANTWFFTKGVNLMAGTSYRITYKYGKNGANYNETFTVKYGTNANVVSMTNLIAEHSNFATTATSFLQDFTPSATGVYYFGFHANSGVNFNNIYVDDILVDESPVCILPAAVIASSITDVTADVSWTAPSTVPANGYEYILSTTNTAPALTDNGTAAAGNTISLNSLTPNTPYYIWVRSVCSTTDKSEWTAVYTFRTPCSAITTLPWTENFDLTTATGTFLSGRVSDCWVGIDKASVMSNASTYIIPQSGDNVLAFQYSTAATGAWGITPTFNLQAGQNYRFKFYYRNYNTAAFDSLKVYLGNGQTVASMTQNIGATLRNITNTTYSEYYVDFTVPTNGNYNLGIRVNATISPMYLNIDDASLDYSPTCIQPSNLVVTSTGTNTADIKWNSSISAPANGYVYYVSTTNTIPTVPSGSVAAPDTTGQITGLNSDTPYYVWIKAACSATDSSVAIGPISFRTKCDAANVPYFENFESITTPALPTCMATNATTGNLWNTFTTNGTKVARYLYHSSQAANSWLYTQGINLTAGQSYRVTYKYAKSGTYSEKIKVAYGTATNAASMTTVIATHDPIAATTFSTNFVDFVAPTSGVYYIGFNSFSAANLGSIYIDDILVELTPTCEVPGIATISDITPNNATATWRTSVSNPTDGYAYYVSTSNVAPTSTAGFTSTVDTTAVITGLNDNTTYYVWTVAVCGAGDSSAIVGPRSFTTECNATNVPYYENFESVTTPALPECTSVINNGTGNLWKTSSQTTLGFSSKVLHYAYNANAANTWFYTKGINLTAGTSYRIKYLYGKSNSSAEKLKVMYGTTKSAAGMVNLITDHTTVPNPAQTNQVDFVPTTSGVYYFGFQAYSASNLWNIYVDDISIELTPTCEQPGIATITNIGGNSATATWISSSTNPANGYVYYVSTTNTAPTASSVVTATTDTTVALTGLTANTQYYVWTAAVCSATDTSAWSGPRSFTTACDAITSIPWLENFDAMSTLGASIVPSCWSTVTGSKAWNSTNSTSTTFPNSGANYMRIAWSNTTASQLWTPRFELQAGTSYRLSFYYNTGQSNNPTGWTGKVFVNNSASLTAATELSTFVTATTNTNGQYVRYNVDYTPTTTGEYTFAISVSSTSAPYYFGVDDVSLDFTPTCAEPNQVTSTISNNAATITWTASPSPTLVGYNYYYSTTNTAPTATTVPSGSTNASTNTATINGLTQNNNYYVWVRSICSGSDTSAWSNPTTFYYGYCIPVADYVESHIDSVYTTGGVVNIANNANGYDASGYSDYYNSDSLVVVEQDTINLTYHVTGPYSAGVSIYVDLNQNMTFESSERLYTTSAYISNTSRTIQIPLPASVAPGSYRARIILDESISTPTACEFEEDSWYYERYGEAEDYKIVVIPACTNPIVDLGNDTTFCSGNTITLNAGTTGTTYLWNNGATTQTIDVNLSGTYTVEVANGTCITRDTINVTVQQQPTVSVTADKLSICPGESVTLTASGATSYTWNDGGVGSPHIVVPTATTTYTVRGSVNGCEGEASISILIKNCVGTEETEAQKVKVYPNPASSLVTIEGDAIEEFYTGYTVIDLTGKVVMESSTVQNGTTIDVKSLVDGIYFIQLTGQVSKSVKLEVKH